MVARHGDAATAGLTEVTVERLAVITIRELVERSPCVMEILAPLGIDLCCGGAHPLGEALDLHGLERSSVLERVARAITSTETQGR